MPASYMYIEPVTTDICCMFAGSATPHHRKTLRNAIYNSLHITLRELLGSYTTLWNASEVFGATTSRPVPYDYYGKLIFGKIEQALAESRQNWGVKFKSRDHINDHRLNWFITHYVSFQILNAMLATPVDMRVQQPIYYAHCDHYTYYPAPKVFMLADLKRFVAADRLSTFVEDFFKPFIDDPTEVTIKDHEDLSARLYNKVVIAMTSIDLAGVIENAFQEYRKQALGTDLVETKPGCGSWDCLSIRG